MAPASKSNSNFKDQGNIKLKVFKAEKDFTNEKKIGEGGFARVFKASTPSDGNIAVKIVKHNISTVVEEIKHMAQRAHHTNLVKIYGTVIDDDGKDIGFVMEFMEGGSLHDVIEDTRSYPVSRVYQWFLGAARGLNHLHEQGLVHRDVKPLNMLLKGDKKSLKICDFGLAKQENQMSRTDAGTRLFMAPEQLIASGKQTYAVDVFALAISWWQMLSRRRLYEHVQPISVYDFINLVAKENGRPLIKFQDKEAADMMKRMWHTDPEERPTMKEVMDFANKKAAATENNKTAVNNKFNESGATGNNKTPAKKLEKMSLGSEDTAGSSLSSSAGSTGGSKKTTNPCLNNWMTSTESVAQWIQKSTLSGELGKLSKTTLQIEEEVNKISNKRTTKTVLEGVAKIKSWINDLLKLVQQALMVNPKLKLLVDYEKSCDELMKTVEEQGNSRIEHLSKKK